MTGTVEIGRPAAGLIGVLGRGEVCEGVQGLAPQRAHGFDGMKDAMIDRGQRIALLDRR
jgi:hypothetical protein